MSSAAVRPRRFSDAERRRFVEARRKSGLSQSDFARRAGIAQAYVSRWNREQTTSEAPAASPVAVLVTATVRVIVVLTTVGPAGALRRLANPSAASAQSGPPQPLGSSLDFGSPRTRPPPSPPSALSGPASTASRGRGPIRLTPRRHTRPSRAIDTPQ
jgi:transposase-like protein